MKEINTLLNHASNLYEKNELPEARSLLEEALAVDSHHVGVLLLLGQVCGCQLEHRAAIKYLEAAREVESQHIEVLFSLGVEYSLVGRYKESHALFDVLISMAPQIGTFHGYLGFALRELGRVSEAQTAFEEALRLVPTDTGVMVHLANLHLKNGAFDLSEGLLKRALMLQPNLVAAHNDLGRLRKKQGRPDLALKRFRHANVLEPENKSILNNILSCLCYIDEMPVQSIAAEHFSMSDRCYSWSCLQKQITPPRHQGGSPLRIGYISGDFGLHPVTSFIEPILIHHDTTRFQIYCYSNRSVSDTATQRLKELKVSWREIYDLLAAEVADIIRTDGIDILVDLSGHTKGNRLDVCALKPAPVMATWLGYPHSTGMQQFDYYISDSLCDPPGETDHLYSEHVLRLPRIFCCYLPPLEFPVVSPPPSEALGRITFGSFNNLAKVSDTTIRLWSAILQRVPESRLLIKSGSLGGQSTQQQLLSRFSQCGISPERILLKAHTQSSLEHLAMYSQVDIALDTYPYHGTTTTCESLWMGVPVISLAGHSHVSRVGGALLTSVGLSELVVPSSEEYVVCAAALAEDKKYLRQLRFALRGMMAESPLMDGAGVTKELEEAYLRMFDSLTCRGVVAACDE